MSKFILGLTGGIGSGKSAVSQRFESLGIVVVDADLASRAVLQPGSKALHAIADHFGGELIGADGTLDRALLRQRVFADPSERAWLERLTHPLIGEYLRNALATATSPYVILVNPLLLETGNHKLCNRVLVVDAGEALQLKRTMARADDIIVNDGELSHLDALVAALHRTYLELAA